MTAAPGFGLTERRATLARIKAGVAGGRVWQGAVPDEVGLPRDTDGRIAPHVVIDFGAPVATTAERNLALPDAQQPYALPANVACIAGDADAAQALAAEVFGLLVDWQASSSADPWEAKGGYGTRRPATENTPTRYIEGLFMQCSVNMGNVLT